MTRSDSWERLRTAGYPTRYADDILLSGGAHLRDARPRIETWVGQIALEEGFALNHRKTRCMTAGRRQSVCNIVVNRHASLPRDEFDRLKAILHRCVTQCPATQIRENMPLWRDHLQGARPVAWRKPKPCVGLSDW